MESNLNLEMKNAAIMGRKFWTSFTKLMEVDSISLNDKLNLVELKTVMASEIDKLAQSMKGLEDSQITELMARDFKADFEPVTVPMEKFNAEDLFQLKGIINMKEQ